MGRNFQRGNQRNAVSPANQLAAGPLQSSSGRLAQHLFCPPRGGVSSEHHREGGIGVRVVANIQNPKYTFSNFNFHILKGFKKKEKSELTFGEPTFQPSPKRCNFFSLFLATPHPRVNDEVKLEGGSKICTRAVAASLIRGRGGG